MPGAPSPAPPQPTVVTDDGTTKVYAVGGGRFVVPAYFDVCKFLGAGSYGQVCAAVDQRDGRKVAIKRVMDIINNDDINTAIGQTVWVVLSTHLIRTCLNCCLLLC